MSTSNRSGFAKKDYFCAENDICLVRLREKPLTPTPKAINIPCDCSTWGKIEQTCRDVIHYLDPKAEVDIIILRDFPEISKYKVSSSEEYHQFNIFEIIKKDE